MPHCQYLKPKKVYFFFDSAKKVCRSGRQTLPKHPFAILFSLHLTALHEHLFQSDLESDRIVRPERSFQIQTVFFSVPDWLLITAENVDVLDDPVEIGHA